jgi:peptidoglycan/LPS O-acetylase OafA/YrhL
MNRQYGIDLARVSAAYMVVFGHLIYGGTVGADGTWAGPSQPLPLLDKHGQSIWKIDAYLSQNWGTASAIVGVSLFFLISGWLIPPMLRKYSSREFITNRVLRIFPMLFCAVLLAAAIQYQCGNRAALRWHDVLSTILLANQITGAQSTLSVLWTLIIEGKFYVLLAVVGVVDYKKLFGVSALIVFLNCGYFCLLKSGSLAGHPHEAQIADSIVHDSYYLLFMFIGVGLWLMLDAPSPNKRPCWSFLSLIAIIAIFNANRWFTIAELGITPHQDINVASQFIVFCLFGGCLFVQKKFAGVHWPSRAIVHVSNVTYSVYLLHLSIGIFLLSRLRHLIGNQYLLLLIVISTITLIAVMTYWLIERPSNRLAKRLSRSRATNPAALSPIA